MPAVRYVCMSDLHLGAPESVLTTLGPRPGGRARRPVDPAQPSPVMKHLAECLRALIERKGDPAEGLPLEEARLDGPASREEGDPGAGLAAENRLAQGDPGGEMPAGAAAEEGKRGGRHGAPPWIRTAAGWLARSMASRIPTSIMRIVSPEPP